MAKKTERAQSSREVEQLAKQYGNLNKLGDSLLTLWSDIDKVTGKTEEGAKKWKKQLDLAADATAQTYQNFENLGTTDFFKVDWGKRMRELRMAFDKGLISKKTFDRQKVVFEGMRGFQDNMSTAQDFSETIASNFGKMGQSISGMLGKLPVVGSTLQKVSEKMMGKAQEKLQARVGQFGKSLFSQERTKKGTGRLDMRFKVNKNMGKMSKGIHNAAHAFKMMGTAGKVAVGATVGILLIGVGLLAKMGKAIFDFANKTGFSYAQTVKLGGALAINEKAVSAISKEFGNVNEITAGMAFQMKRMSLQFAISEENAAAILRIQKAVSGATNEQLLNMQMATAQLARQKGVAPADVFADIAASTEAFAKFSSDGGRNVMAAAVSAKSLGINLSAVEKVAEGLLDIEGSIGKQMEASVLIGRELNLDRARQLALSGDLEGVLGEVRKQVGGEAEFNRLNVIQRQKLAAAVGLSTTELARLTTANANTLTAGAAATGAAVSEGVKAQVEATQGIGDQIVRKMDTGITINTDK